MTADEQPSERRHSPEVQLAVFGTQLTTIVRDLAVVSGKVDGLDRKIDTKTDALSVKLDAKVDALALKVDVIDAEQQRARGVLAVVRFLGISGVAVASLALLKAFGAPLP